MDAWKKGDFNKHHKQKDLEFYIKWSFLNRFFVVLLLHIKAIFYINLSTHNKTYVEYFPFFVSFKAFSYIFYSQINPFLLYCLPFSTNIIILALFATICLFDGHWDGLLKTIQSREKKYKYQIRVYKKKMMIMMIIMANAKRYRGLCMFFRCILNALILFFKNIISQAFYCLKAILINTIQYHIIWNERHKFLCFKNLW